MQNREMSTVRKTFRSLVALALILGGATAPALAQDEMQPLLLLSFKGFAELQKDLDFVGELSDNPEMGEGLEGLLGMLTGGQDVEEVLDKSKPWGAAVSSDGVEFQILAFLPIKDTEQFLTSVGSIAGAPQDEGNGVWKLDAPGMSLYFKGHNDWTFVSLSPDFLANLPDDPQKLLTGIDSKHDLAVQMHVQNIPEIFRTLAVEQIKQGINQQLEQRAAEGGAAPSDAIRQFAEQEFETISQGMNDVDIVTFGGSIDPEARKAIMDLAITAKDGTEMAKLLSGQCEMKSNFGGFQIADAALAANICTTMSAAETERIKKTIGQLRDRLMEQANLGDVGAGDDVQAVAKDLLTRLFGVLDTMFEGNKVDAGFAMIGEGPFTIVAGGASAKPEDLQKLLEDLAKTLETELGFYGFEMDVVKHEGVRFHRVAVPLPGGEIGDQLTNLFGFDLELCFGVGENAVYVAAGKDGVDHLKKVIDESKSSAGQPAPPIRGHAKLAALMKLMGEGEAPEGTPDLSALKEIEAGKDRVTITSQPKPNGVTIHIEAEEGLIKILPGLVTSIGLPAGIGGF